MIGILVIAHDTLAESLVACVTHVLGARPEHLGTYAFKADADANVQAEAIEACIATLNQGDGVLVLADVYGATPCNTLCRLLRPDHVEGVSGSNLPMLLKAINYRGHMTLVDLVEQIVQGGRSSINHITETMCNAATGN
jgi:PTS system mannose-specific IIA component